MIQCALNNEFFEGSTKPEECRSMSEDYFWTNVHKVCLLPDRGKIIISYFNYSKFV